MRIAIRHACAEAEGYRSALMKSLFNVESGASFALDADLPLEERPWSVGLVVGPSGSGKSSIGRALWGGEGWREEPLWPEAPIVEALAPQAAFDEVVAALSAVGLGSAPAWLRPYAALSTGERFRADLARILCEKPRRIVIDEFTSVVDRRVATIGAAAFAKAWRREAGGAQVVALSCHRDVIPWLDPDWVYDTGPEGGFSWRSRSRPPSLLFEIVKTDWRHWPRFEPHHYLKLPKMIAAFCYVACHEGEPVAHLAVSTRPGLKEARACRLVVMPEWQGAGVGLRFLNEVCALWRRGENPYGRPMPTLFHTSHPGLAAALRRSPLWAQSLKRSAEAGRLKTGSQGGFSGHMRAVQGFRYLEGCA